jgi:cell division transport system permease protein
MAPKPSSARISRPRRFNPRGWLMRHLQVALASLGRLARSPLASLMTLGVIGIALALPSALHLLLLNVESMSGDWDNVASISLYLEPLVDERQAESLARRIGDEPGVAETRLIGRDQALAEFRAMSGFSEALNSLASNPLPAVIIVTPATDQAHPAALERLSDHLKALPGVDIAQLDLQWVQRFHAITEIAGRAVWVLATLLGIAVVLTVFNTIRLEIQARQQEIEISKLIGATDAFIRRPFLYSGFWYGALGGLLCWLLVTFSLWLLNAPVARLAGLYESAFALSGMSFDTVLLLLCASTLLGLAGSWIAVGRHLRRIDPT